MKARWLASLLRHGRRGGGVAVGPSSLPMLTSRFPSVSATAGIFCKMPNISSNPFLPLMEPHKCALDAPAANPAPPKK